LFWCVVGIVLMLVTALVTMSHDIRLPDREFVAFAESLLVRLTTASVLALSIYALVSIPCARVAALRLHDIGVSGWWALAMFAFVPFDLLASILWLAGGGELPDRSLELSVVREVHDSGVLYAAYLVGFVFCLFWPPTRGANRFGPDPRTEPPSVTAE
jgi:uncharacterized membrane protein YhaH (DUF805 family)